MFFERTLQGMRNSNKAILTFFSVYFGMKASFKRKKGYLNNPIKIKSYPIGIIFSLFVKVFEPKNPKERFLGHPLFVHQL